MCVCFQLFFKNRGILNEEGFILFVRKNAIIILIPKFGLEGTVFFENKDKPSPKMVFDEEVSKRPSIISLYTSAHNTIFFFFFFKFTFSAHHRFPH